MLFIYIFWADFFSTLLECSMNMPRFVGVNYPTGGHPPMVYLTVFSFFPSLYTARPSFEYYRQVFFVHSGLQDESLQVTISKLP